MRPSTEFVYTQEASEGEGDEAGKTKAQTAVLLVTCWETPPYLLAYTTQHSGFVTVQVYVPLHEQFSRPFSDRNTHQCGHNFLKPKFGTVHSDVQYIES